MQNWVETLAVKNLMDDFLVVGVQEAGAGRLWVALDYVCTCAKDARSCLLAKHAARGVTSITEKLHVSSIQRLSNRRGSLFLARIQSLWMVSSHLPLQNNTSWARGELWSAYRERICIGMRAFDPGHDKPLDPADTAIALGKQRAVKLAALRDKSHFARDGCPRWDVESPESD